MCYVPRTVCIAFLVSLYFVVRALPVRRFSQRPSLVTLTLDLLVLVVASVQVTNHLCAWAP